MTFLNSIRAAAIAVGALYVGAAATASAQECQNAPTGTRLTIVIDDVRDTKGEMSASVYPGDPSQFLRKNGALKVWYAPVRMPSTDMCIWIPGPGTYAVAVYQDWNMNHKFDHNILRGIEPFGFSDNPSILFSQPPFERAKFRVTSAETTIHIRLNHK